MIKIKYITYKLCSFKRYSAKQIALILNRNENYIYSNYILPMKDEGRLQHTIYCMFNLIGHLKAIFFRTHLVLSQKIVIRYGLFDTLEIALDSITAIQKFEGDYEKSNELVKFALPGKLEPHNIPIQLKENIPVNLPFGITKGPKRILLYIDNPADFLKIVGDKTIENDTFLRTASLQL
jgi:hypothetical protein